MTAFINTLQTNFMWAVESSANSIEAALSGSVTEKFATISEKIATIWLASSTHRVPYAIPVAGILIGPILTLEILDSKAGKVVLLALAALACYNIYQGKLFI